MNISFPFSVTPAGHTRTCDRQAHIRHLIELVLFTSPGERLMRPDFGSGVQDLVFSAAGTSTTHATLALVEGALQHALRDVIEVKAVDVEFDEPRLKISVVFVDRHTELEGVVELEAEP